MERAQEIIIENIKHEMRKNNLRQHDVAELLELADSTLSNQLNGRNPFTEKSLEKLCEIFGLTYEQLTGERKKTVVVLNPPRNTVKILDERFDSDKKISPTRDLEMEEIKKKQEEAKQRSTRLISAMELIMDNINDLQTTV